MKQISYLPLDHPQDGPNPGCGDDVTAAVARNLSDLLVYHHAVSTKTILQM